MADLIMDSLLDAGMDTIKLVPFLFVTYLVMEALERHTEEKSQELIRKENVGRFGPVFGAVVGIVPQCGFSAAAASLYAGGLISLGTLLAVFLSTSDEMLPLLISAQVPVLRMVKILAVKAFLALLTGLVIDILLRDFHYRHHQHAQEKHIHDLCEQEHCGCEEEEGSVLKSALVHTLHITVFVFLITLVLTLVVEGFGEDVVRDLLTGHPAAGVFLSSLVGLIPNCASSVMLTQLYLDGLIEAGQMLGGLLVSSGVGLLVLFRTNSHHLKENVKITGILYAAGVFWGLVLTFLGVAF